MIKSRPASKKAPPAPARSKRKPAASASAKSDPAVGPVVAAVVAPVLDDMVDQLVAMPEHPLDATMPDGTKDAGESGKQKLIRDSFTMPKNEYQAIDALKMRLLRLSHAARKSELLRAGVSALTRMSDSELLAAVGKVPSLKTGRPKKEKGGEKPASKRS